MLLNDAIAKAKLMRRCQYTSVKSNDTEFHDDSLVASGNNFAQVLATNLSAIEYSTAYG